MKPIQPLYTDKDGVIRFRENKIVRYLLDNGGIDMNDLARVSDFSNEDREQFAQLIGYSLGGFSDLGYVSDTTYYTAEKMHKGVDEKDARINTLIEQLNEVRKGLRVICPAVFRVHPDDLQEHDV